MSSSRKNCGNLKVFPDGLMDDMASKNISSCTVYYTALPMKTDLHFQPVIKNDGLGSFRRIGMTVSHTRIGTYAVSKNNCREFLDDILSTNLMHIINIVR